MEYSGNPCMSWPSFPPGWPWPGFTGAPRSDLAVVQHVEALFSCWTTSPTALRTRPVKRTPHTAARSPWRAPARAGRRAGAGSQRASSGCDRCCASSFHPPTPRLPREVTGFTGWMAQKVKGLTVRGKRTGAISLVLAWLGPLTPVCAGRMLSRIRGLLLESEGQPAADACRAAGFPAFHRWAEC